jgi:hypothetical protein
MAKPWPSIRSGQDADMFFIFLVPEKVLRIPWTLTAWDSSELSQRDHACLRPHFCWWKLGTGVASFPRRPLKASSTVRWYGSIYCVS